MPLPTKPCILGFEGEGAFDAIVELLVHSGYVTDDSECRNVRGKLSENFGKHGLVKDEPSVISLATPFRVYDGMDEEEAPAEKPEPVDGPLLLNVTNLRLKEGRGRRSIKVRCNTMYLAEMEAAKAGMPAVAVSHSSSGEGATVRDIHMENFNVSVAVRDFIVDCTMTLSFGCHYVS